MLEHLYGFVLTTSAVWIASAGLMAALIVTSAMKSCAEFEI